MVKQRCTTRAFVVAGFIDGWAVGRKCLSRQLAFTGSYETVMFDRYEDMVAALMKGKVGCVLCFYSFVCAFRAYFLERLSLLALNRADKRDVVGYTQVLVD